jgi:phosphatidyl-myo-inositol dimannoside synthase
MNILVVTWNFPPRRGGMEKLLAGLCHGLRKDHRLLIITSYAEDRCRDDKYIFRPNNPGLVNFFLYALWKGTLLLRRHSEVTVVFGGSVLVVPIVLFLSMIFRRKAVVQAHGLDLIYRNALYQLVCVRGLKFCDKIIANSAFTASLINHNRGRPDLIAIIPPGVSPENFLRSVDVQAIKNDYGLQGKQLILFVGRLVRRKGVIEFIENCLVRIVPEFPGVCFIIVGDNPNDALTHQEDVLGQIQSRVSEMKLDEHVKLLGALDDDAVVDLYRACDIVVLPALAMLDDVEGFGIVLLEAAAAGKPVVTTRTGGITEAVEPDTSGIIIAPEDYESMTESIIHLLGDEETRLIMGQYAQSRVIERFSWNAIIPRYEEQLL